jgi:hypothetical protein
MATPPKSLEEFFDQRVKKALTLTRFIEASQWNYAALDIVDRRPEIKELGTEDFWDCIGGSPVPLEDPGHLSPVTVGKVIEYGITLLEIFYGPLAEGTSREKLRPARVIHWLLERELPLPA